jgi:hypothetical protein
MQQYAASTLEIRDVLSSLGLATAVVEALTSRIAVGTVGLMLYGSRARGDFIVSSDYDILRLSRSQHPTFSVGTVSVSSYTTAQLSSASATLFGTHIARDGRILLDTDGELASIVRGLEPAEPLSLMEQVRRFSTVVDLPDYEVTEHIAGVTRLVRYLLRTAIYAKAMRQGRPCFSVRELSRRFDDPSLATLLASNTELTGPPSLSMFKELRDRLLLEIGSFPALHWESLEQIGVEMWDVDRNVSALAIRAGSEDDVDLDYTDLPKVLL